MTSVAKKSMSNPNDRSLIRVLVAHAERVERVRLIRPLRAHFGRSVEADEACSAEEAASLLGESFFDVVLVAEDLASQSGLDLATHFAKISPESATILVADEETPNLAAEVAQSACSDYVLRGRIDSQQLARAISGAIRQIHLQRDYHRMVRRMSESYDQMDHLIRALSHDMNANFMLMENSFSTLQKRLDVKHGQEKEPELKEIASHVRACMTESRRFLNDLVGLARTGRVEMDPELADTDGVIEEVLFEQRELLRARGVAVDVDESLPRLWCNRHRLKQVVTNLIRNALKHGTDRDVPRLAVTGTNDCEQAGMALLRIYDNGPGIPAEWQKEIFMPGRRAPGTESDGTGMGLAIVRKIVRHYGGEVRVESEPGEGTTFEIRLPSVGRIETGNACAPDGVGHGLGMPDDRRFDHDSPHDDPRLHPHRRNAARPEPGKHGPGSDV